MMSQYQGLRACGLLLSILLAVSASLAQQGAAKTDKDKLQGTWVAVSGESGGAKLPDEVVKAQSYEFRGDIMVVKLDGVEFGSLKFTLDESKKPKELNIMVGSLGTNPAIYEFDGDRLKICMDKPGGIRPKGFKTEKGTAQKLFVFERSK